jgi:hypothetical protein
VLEAKTIQKYKSKSMSYLIEKAQELVNAYVRKRDSLYDGEYFVCISCDKLKPKSKCNAGHFYSRGNFGSVRFNLDNIHAQCIKCNLHLHGNLIPYQKNLIKKIGQARFDNLEMMAYAKGFKHDRFMLIDIIEKYKNAS